jgi:hypothetical protein
MKAGWRSLCALAFAGALPCIPAHGADVHKLLEASRQRIETADYRVTGRLVRVDATGNRLSVPISIKAHNFPSVLRVLVEIGQPKNGCPQGCIHILLEMRPNGQNVIKIAHLGETAPAILPFDKWSDGPLGGAFAYEDFLEQQYYWPGQEALPEAIRGARNCDVVMSTPGENDRTNYSQVKTWLDHSTGFPVYAEKSLKGSGAVKEVTYLGLRHNGGVWSAGQVEAKIHGRAGSTLLIVERGSAKANLTLKDFSPEQLIRF